MLVITSIHEAFMEIDTSWTVKTRIFCRFLFIYLAKAKNFDIKWAICHFFVLFNSREKFYMGISLKCGPNSTFLSVLIIEAKNIHKNQTIWCFFVCIKDREKTLILSEYIETMSDFLNFFSTYILKENVDEITILHFGLHFIYFFLI